MSIAAAETINQLNLTLKNVAAEESETKLENKGSSNFTTFPWLKNILRMCREAIATRRINSLDGLLYAFAMELSVSIKDCYSRPNRAAKLRNIVNEMLVYIDMIYQDLKADCVDNNSTYLHIMTDILAIYLDLEIKSSKRGVHSLKKIAQFMTTALYTHLGQSEDHIVEAILKAKLITKSAGELCAPVLQKVLKDSRCFIGDENAYVRFLLAFKLLYKITKRANRHAITKMAVRKLDPVPELVEIVRKMNNIFPMAQMTVEPITSFLMNVNFNFIKAKREFLRTSDISGGSLSEFYSEKTLAYGNHCDTLTNLLKSYRKLEESRGNSMGSDYSNNWEKKNCSTDFESDPSLYRISSRGKSPEEKTSGEDSSNSWEVEFLGTRNKADRPVVVITLDSDEEREEVKMPENATNESEKTAAATKPLVADIPSEETKARDEDEKKEEEEVEEDEDRKNWKSDGVSESVNVKLGTEELETCREIDSVPEQEKNLIMDSYEEVSSTNLAGGELPFKLQSPEHGVVDSTNSLSVLERQETVTQEEINAQAAALKMDSMTAKKMITTPDDITKIITTAAKKVNFENVAKSYKIVKSNCLKTSSVSLTQCEKEKEKAREERTESRYRSPPKFVRIDKSGIIGKTVTVQDCMKPLNVSLDFRTPSAIAESSGMSGDEAFARHVAFPDDSRLRGSTAKHSPVPSAPVIYKAPAEELTGRKSRTRGGSRTESGKTGRKSKSQNTAVIKTDIHMKSTLKHINPSAIPQFAEAERKRKMDAEAKSSESNAGKVSRVSYASPVDVSENRTVEIKLILPEKYFSLQTDCRKSNNKSVEGDAAPDESCLSISPYVTPSNPPYYPVKSAFQSSTPRPDSTVAYPCDSVPPPLFKFNPVSCQTHEPENVQIPHPLAVQMKVDPLKTTVESSRVEQIPPMPSSYPNPSDFPALNCEFAERQDRLANECLPTVADKREPQLLEGSGSQAEGGGYPPTSNAGAVFPGPRCPVKARNAPRDIIISETFERESRDVDEDLRKFVERLESDYFPDDVEYLLQGLPDHHNLFSEEDFITHLPDRNFPACSSLDCSDLGAFPDKYPYDLRGDRFLDDPLVENILNENFFAENITCQRFLDCDLIGEDVKRGLGELPGPFDTCKKSQRVSSASPEVQGDGQAKPRHKKGTNSSNNRKEKDENARKPNTRERARSKLGLYVEGTSSEKVDKKKLRSDSVAYHTRSISQKGIPIEFTIAPLKRSKKRKTRTN